MTAHRIVLKTIIALVLVAVCILTQITCFDVFNTNAWYLYVILASSFILQFVLSVFAFKLQASHVYFVAWTIIYSILSAWNALAFVCLIVERLIYKDDVTFGLYICGLVGHVCLLLLYIRQQKKDRSVLRGRSLDTKSEDNAPEGPIH